jgi:hypothetical protein
MGQENIVKALEKSRVPLSANEIAKEIDDTIISVCRGLSQMLKYNEIKCIELNKDLSYKFYKCKRKMRLYYV